MEASSFEAESWPVGSVFRCVRRLFLSHPENISGRGRSPLMHDLARCEQSTAFCSGHKRQNSSILNHVEPGCYKIKWTSPEKSFFRKFLLACSHARNSKEGCFSSAFTPLLRFSRGAKDFYERIKKTGTFTTNSWRAHWPSRRYT